MLLLLPATYGQQIIPKGIVLTWQNDPTSTMTIDWHVEEGRAGAIKMVEMESHTGSPIRHPEAGYKAPAELYYRPAAGGEWHRASGITKPFPFIEERVTALHRDGYSHSTPAQIRTIYRVELTGLDDDTLFEFRFDDKGEIHRFRTMPAKLDREVRIAMGGDVKYGIWAERMNELAASYDPDFVVWGGDFSYGDGLQERLGRWYNFFASMQQSLVAEGNRRIPVLTGIGNHEARGGYWERSEQATGIPYTQTDSTRLRIAPYYYNLFAFPGQPGYGTLDFGDYLTIMLLDSGHSNPVEGEQTSWLADALEQRADVPHIFPVYHVPAFPSNRSLEDPRVLAVRKNWVPLFEKNNLTVVFENHDHNYKRTRPIRGNEAHSEGVTYLGDGCWGVMVTGMREDPARDWYLEKTEPVNHFILVTLDGNEVETVAYDISG
ncbi:MAG: metallophosphoesterase, partial [Balneolales bacterium]